MYIYAVEMYKLVRIRIEPNHSGFDLIRFRKDSKPINSKFRIISSSILNHSPLSLSLSLFLSSLYLLSPILYQRILIFVHARALIHHVSVIIGLY